MNELTRLACAPETVVELDVERSVPGDDERRSPGGEHLARATYGTSIYARRSRRSDWSTEDLRRLRELAGSGMPLNAIAAALRRTASAVKNKAGMHGISLRMAR